LFEVFDAGLLVVKKLCVADEFLAPLCVDLQVPFIVSGFELGFVEDQQKLWLGEEESKL